jgi:signal transduction histidine kinase/CheY-like chemotaxis protein
LEARWSPSVRSGELSSAESRSVPRQGRLRNIRSHLVILVLAAAMPIIVFAAILTAIFWHQQRVAFEQRYLERVRAMSIALDRELDGHVRVLQTLAHSPLLAVDDMRGFYEQATRVKTEQRGWATVILADTTGAQVFNLRRPFGAPLPRTAFGDAAIARVVATGQPVIAPLIKGAVLAAYTTNVGIPVKRHGIVSHVLIVAIDPPAWLEFLGRYPIAPDATMTLLDQDGVVIARTLNNERWIGQRPAPALYEKSRVSSEGAYRSQGLEGQRFYSAHSRSTLSGWTVATGVPAAGVEAALWNSTLVMAGGAVLSAALAVGLAYLFGRKIAQPIAVLARSAAALAAGGPLPQLPSTTITEVAETSQAFTDAAVRLQRRETALREAHAVAEDANRTKDEFLAVLSHELRTPINAVYGWTRMLHAGQIAEGGTERALDAIMRNAHAQVQLIDDLLDVSRIVTGKLRLDVRPVDLTAVVEAALDAVRPAAEAKDIRLQRVLDPGTARIMGDADRLQQVVWNLMTNAIKFTPKGGRVQVNLQRVNSHIEIVVSDTGEGISADMLPMVFERFRQDDTSSTRVHRGLGLGLALVRHLVEAHGGTVVAQSPGKGEGATFVVKLPVALAKLEEGKIERAHPMARVALPTYAGPALEGVRVLVVDDDGDALDLATAILVSARADVKTSASAAEALDVFRVWRPDVMIADIEMPGEDGLSLIRKIRALDPTDGGKVPAVALTAYGRVEDRMKTLSAGFSMHVPKPVDPVELTTIVASLAGREAPRRTDRKPTEGVR